MTLPGIPNPAIPYGSLVVVSGASGFIGSHVADQLLAAGFKVRGTTRDTVKHSWIDDYFREKYGVNQFELVEVQDMTVAGAFDLAAKGASGFIHVANEMTGSKDPHVAVPRAVAGALNALTALAKEPGHKRFVYTSSSFAATLPKPGLKFAVHENTYNDESVQQAWQPDPPGDAVYAASKVESERALLHWINEHKPDLAINIICPNANIGTVINPAKQGYPTSARWVKALWDHDYESLKNVPPQYYINVQDDAKLHVIGLVNPTVQNERLFAVAAAVSMQDIIEILRRNFPEKEWEDFYNFHRDLSTFTALARAEQLLEEAYGTKFVRLDESVKDNAAALVG